MRVYIGPDSYQKREFIFKQMNRGGSVTVITPEQSTLAYEAQMIEMLDLPGMIDVQVTSFNHILNQLSREIYHPKQEHISEIGKKMLFRDILEELGPKLRIFRNLDKEGFYEALEATIERFMRDEVGPEALEALLEEQNPDSLIYQKLSDLAQIYTRFQERITGQYFDEEQRLALFEAEGHRFRLYSSEEVWLVDFKHIDARTLRMLRAMEAHTKRLCIALSYEPDKPWIYAITQETLELLQANFPNLEIIAVPTEPTPIRELAENLHNLDPEPVDANLRIFVAEDRYEEVEFIGLDILKKLRHDASLRLDDIRIIAADLEGYEFTIRSVFQQLGLPIFSDERKAIAKNRIVKSILALMNIYLDRYRREDVISFLRGHLEAEAWDDLDRFENYLIENGINFKRFQARLADREMEQLRQKFLGVVLAHETHFRPQQSVAEFCDRLLELFKALAYEERIEASVDLYEQRGELEQMRIITQVWNALIDALGQLKQVAGEKRVSFRRFKRYFDSAIRDLSVGVIPPVENRITLATLHRSTHAPCRIMYFCGMAEGVVPKDYLDSGLLKHQEKYRLREMGYRYFDTPEFNENLDVLDQFIALSMVKEELIFSFAGSNYSREAMSSSLYINRAQGLTGAKMERGLQNHYMEHEQIAFRYALEAVREGREEAIDQITPEALAGIETALAAPVLTPAIDRSGVFYTTSTSRLERFRRCPFSYFVAYDLQPVRRRQFVVEPMDIGDLYHLLIQRALEAYQAGQLKRDGIGAFIDATMPGILKLEKFERFSHTAASRYFVRRMKRIARFVIGVLLDNIARSEFEPTYFEKSVQLGLERFVLHGKIDRVDIKDQRFSVTDYKSGSKRFDLNSIYQGIDLQLVLYADALAQAEQKDPAGIFIFNIRDPIVDSDDDRDKAMRLSGLKIGDIEGLDAGSEGDFLPRDHISSQQMKQLTQRVRRKSVEYIQRIEKGDIRIEPIRQSNQLACDYCEYGAICRFDRLRRGFRIDQIENIPNREILAQLDVEPENEEA